MCGVFILLQHRALSPYPPTFTTSSSVRTCPTNPPPASLTVGGSESHDGEVRITEVPAEIFKHLIRCNEVRNGEIGTRK